MPAARVTKLFLALVVLSFLAGCVERQFFYPDRTVYTTPQQFGLASRDVTIPGPDGSRLHGWWLPAQGPVRGTVLHLHGNAANISNHLPLVEWLPKAGFNLLTFDYRGFGQSSGEPSLDGVVADSLAALRWLRQQPGVNAQRVVVLGQSLGGATAVRTVVADPAGVKLLVLDCPFSSYRGIARDAVRGSALAALLPAAQWLLPGAERDPLTAVKKLTVPVFVLHSADDTVVPLAHGRALFAAAPEPKQWLEVQQTQHVDGLTHEPVRQQVIAAMQTALQAP
ncbi:alpha/beta hydrolase [Ideonella sp. BN130291]|uniref:alpha/beta hydrolase n=1 Tax=Ideonella sp. BN130291 TaxID=3112940 RepID=UPI002E25FBF9|nr:alpha/beta hydrolase [Ideonella sp. BN130291]